MMEVLVGFTLLMILLTSLTHIIKVSTELLFKSKDIIELQNEFNENRYKIGASYQEISGMELSFSIDEEQTALDNSATPVEIRLDDVYVESFYDDGTDIKIFKVMHR